MPLAQVTALVVAITQSFIFAPNCNKGKRCGNTCIAAHKTCRVGGSSRPASPSVHVKVWIERVERLTTQIYFEGDPFNETDPWVEDDLSCRPTTTVPVGSWAIDLVIA